MIRVVVAASSQLLRHLLQEGLSARGSIAVAATAADRLETLALVEDLSADVTLVSSAMPDAEPLIETLLERGMHTVVVGVCSNTDVAALADGTLDDLVAMIHAANRGKVSRTSAASNDLDLLTRTEHRVLHLVNEGHSNKEIARALGVAVPTVKHHVHSLLTKLGVRRRGEAAAVYRRHNPPLATRRRAPGWSLRSTSASRD